MIQQSHASQFAPPAPEPVSPPAVEDFGAFARMLDEKITDPATETQSTPSAKQADDRGNQTAKDPADTEDPPSTKGMGNSGDTAKKRDTENPVAGGSRKLPTGDEKGKTPVPADGHSVAEALVRGDDEDDGGLKTRETDKQAVRQHPRPQGLEKTPHEMSHTDDPTDVAPSEGGRAAIGVVVESAKDGAPRADKRAEGSGPKEPVGTGNKSTPVAEKLLIIDLRPAVPANVHGEQSSTRDKAKAQRRSEVSDVRISLPLDRPDAPERESPEIVREVRGVPGVFQRSERSSDPVSARSAQPTVPTRFQETLQSEVVKHSTFILQKNDGAGELRLVLRPEALGNVRIRLTMQSGRLDGQIIVENNTVKEMFESALPGIQNGLREEGFETASLQVSVGHREADQRRPADKWLDGEQIAEEFDNRVPDLVDIDQDHGVINLMA